MDPLLLVHGEEYEFNASKGPTVELVLLLHKGLLHTQFGKIVDKIFNCTSLVGRETVDRDHPFSRAVVRNCGLCCGGI